MYDLGAMEYPILIMMQLLSNMGYKLQSRKELDISRLNLTDTHIHIFLQEDVAFW